MIGAIIGDIAGSIYEFNNIKTKDFPLFAKGSDITDDSLMTIAVASGLLLARDKGLDVAKAVTDEMRKIGRLYPHPMGAYGGRFSGWLRSHDPKPYNSLGNGSAMRVAPCGDMASTLEEALALAKASAEVTHNHPEGIKGAQAVAAAIYMAKTGSTIDEIRRHIHEHYYPLTQTLDELRPVYRFNETCQGTVPQAIIAFLESTSFEDAIRNAVSLGGDCDTLTDITGAIAWPYYARRGIDDTMRRLKNEAMAMIPDDLKDIVTHWEAEFGA